VFPDTAVLPLRGAGGANAGASNGGAPPDGSTLAAAAGAALSVGGMPDSSAGSSQAGAPVEGGAGGSSGASAASCAAPQQLAVKTTLDTWIEAKSPNSTHGSDAQLSVLGGGSERRALLGFVLPAAPAGALLLGATLHLRLESNADVTHAARSLAVNELLREASPARATWLNYGSGASRRWTLAGGDFGAALTLTPLPAEKAAGPVVFDVTELARSAFAAQSPALGLIVREVGLVPSAPAELAFTSSEGDASSTPSLVIEYCLP
jgi:hypothetical protein